jgi:hypothetical protein
MDLADEQEFDGSLRSVVEPALEHGENVWAVVHGRDGSSLVGTDRRLMIVREHDPVRDEDEAAPVESWPHEALDDLLVIPGGLLVRRRKDHHHLATVPLPKEPGERTLQAVTVIALLLASAARRARFRR